MAEFPALPLFTDAYLGDTIHLTTLQHGAYLLMLITAWRTSDCSLPNDDEFLARITRMDRRTWNQNKERILSFWRLNENNKFEQGRLKDERNYVDQQRNKNVEAGRISALKRKERDSTTVPTQSQHKVNQPTPTPTPTSINNKKDIINTYPEDFEKFWIQYPKNNGAKKPAYEKFKQALKEGINHEIIINGASKYSAFVASEGTEQRFIKHAATWLNQRGWETDYLTIIPRRSGKSSSAREYAEKALAELEDSGLFGPKGT